MKTASPLEIAYTLVFIVLFGLALRNAVRKVRALMRIARYQPPQTSTDWPIAWGDAEQALLITGVVVMLLSIGVLALILPPNPANPNALWPGIAFLIMAGLIAAVIVRKDHWDTRIAAAVKRDNGDDS